MAWKTSGESWVAAGLVLDGRRFEFVVRICRSNLPQSGSLFQVGSCVKMQEIAA
jgi:hypothetical protein